MVEMLSHKAPDAEGSPFSEGEHGRGPHHGQGHGHSVASYKHPSAHTEAPASSAPDNGPASAQPGAAPQDEKQVDSQKVTSIVSALHKELDAVFYTSNSKILASLRGLSASELDAVRREYKGHYGGNLDELVKQHLKGTELAEAQASLSGNKARSYAVALVSSRGTLGIDRGKVKEILTEINACSEPQRQELLGKVKSEYHTLTQKDLDAELSEQLSDKNSLSGRLLNTVTFGSYGQSAHKDADSHEAVALLSGDTTRAEAAKLDAERGFLGIGGGTDWSALLASLRKCKTPAQRNKLVTAYCQKIGKSSAELRRPECGVQVVPGQGQPQRR